MIHFFFNVYSCFMNHKNVHSTSTFCKRNGGKKSIIDKSLPTINAKFYVYLKHSSSNQNI